MKEQLILQKDKKYSIYDIGELVNSKCPDYQLYMARRKSSPWRVDVPQTILFRVMLYKAKDGIPIDIPSVMSMTTESLRKWCSSIPEGVNRDLDKDRALFINLDFPTGLRNYFTRYGEELYWYIQPNRTPNLLRAVSLETRWAMVYNQTQAGNPPNLGMFARDFNVHFPVANVGGFDFGNPDNVGTADEWTEFSSYLTENSYTVWANESIGLKTIKTIKNESTTNTTLKFQGEEIDLRRGSISEGHRICCKESKATIAIGHLDYRTITG